MAAAAAGFSRDLETEQDEKGVFLEPSQEYKKSNPAAVSPP